MKVGILGAGGMGNVHARQYAKMPDVELSFFDPDAERTDAYVKQWSVNPATSVEDLISRSDIVDICLPTDLHEDLSLQAIAAGKALFVEKPLAGNLAACRRIIDAASSAGVTLGVGQVVRFFPEFETGNRIVKQGGVGTPAAARTRRGGGAPSGKNAWFMNHSRSGGVILDLAIHDFDWLRWTLGEVKHLYARSVGATTGTGPDYALITLTFDSGAVAHVESTWMDPNGSRTTFEVCGSEGMIEWDSRTNAGLRTKTDGPEIRETPLAPMDDPYYKELRAFVDAVRDKTAPPVTGEDGFMAVSIALAAIHSAKTGEVVVPERL